MSYDRIRDEITAYDAIARDNLQQDIDRLTGNLVGRELVAQYRKASPVQGFPHPHSVWIDSRTSALSQLQAYEWLSPIGGARFVQLGGSGSHAVKAAIGGAGEAWLVTPMAEEAAVARRMAAHVGVGSGLRVIVAIGEELPLANESVDRMYGGGTLHHMEMSHGLREISRVLAPGGRAAFVDPQLNWVYRLLEATRIRGLAREPGARCYPIKETDVYENAGGVQVGGVPAVGRPNSLRYRRSRARAEDKDPSGLGHDVPDR
ncbi:MAG: class I SAM-dependent methyltransferase [Chloroflexi bacterium]|nr:class I SAM-dependent methyltransferase [Chloroflexota bacterium]